MALFGKDDKLQRPDDVRPFVVGGPPRPSDAPASEDAAQTQLGKGSRIEGKLNFEGSVRIDGQIDGEIEAQDTIIIGDTAVINAHISAGTVIVKGKVIGDVDGRKRVELRSPGKLTGNITTPSLVIHEGVIFEGHCSMGGSEARGAESKVTPLSKEEKGGNGVLARIASEATK